MECGASVFARAGGNRLCAEISGRFCPRKWAVCISPACHPKSGELRTGRSLGRRTDLVPLLIRLDH